LELEKFLQLKKLSVEDNLFTEIGEISNLRRLYHIKEIRCVCSKEFHLVQLADLFAGLSCYSFMAYGRYAQWINDNNHTLPLFSSNDLGIKPEALSNSDKERLPFLKYFLDKAKASKIRVSIEQKKGLCSMDPTEQINFWLYTPQREDDKAPVKQRKSF
jgi:hypothetical protein